MSRVKWGVIGSGGIARRRTIPEGIVPSRNSDLACVYDVDQTANDEVARQYGAAAAGSVEELLASGIDAVYIATPAHLHCAQVRQAAGAGKHVFSEKPLGMTVAEAEGMIAAAKQAGVVLGTAFMMRYHSQHQAALAMIREGRLGQPVFGRAQLSCWYPPIPGAWRQDAALGGGGSLIDMGGHTIDLLEMFFGPVEKVSCFVNNTVQGYAPEDSAVATLLFRNGAMGVVDAFFCIPDEASGNALELYGSRGSICSRGTIGQGSAGVMTARLQREDAGYDARQQRGGPEETRIEPAPVNIYQAEIEEFSQAVLEGREPAVSGEDGLRSQQILAACYESARSGRTVAIV
jgi:predicted dehydrogenase